MSAGSRTDHERPAEERLSRKTRAALDAAEASARAVEREVHATAVHEMRGFLFGEQFRTAVAKGRAQDVDRSMWRRIFISSPEAFDFAMSQDWGDPK